MTIQPGAHSSSDGTRFTVRAPMAERLWLCLFESDVETRLPMARDGDWHSLHVPAIGPGQRYGYRAEGRYAPAEGLWFDAAKLLVDPYALELDRAYAFHPDLAHFGVDTAVLVPKAIIPLPFRGEAGCAAVPPIPGGLIYELNVRGFTMLHPDVPPEQRGTIAALAHPAIIAHLKKLRVSAVELMPIVAWIDERHLSPRGLSNAWGYNPVTLMALDPRLAPGGVAELRETVAALHVAGIGVILDLVFNHSGESDVLGPTLSLRGLDNSVYARADDGRLINDTGCGNTFDFGQPHVRQMTLDTLRHFAGHCGVDGFRFDLATIMARSPGFDPSAPIFAEIAADPLLADRLMIAEPWDIGPGGYQLGKFPPDWLEWNDRYRDDVRRFWKGEGRAGALATRLAGSADIFGPVRSRSVNFLAAHDGFTLADSVSYEHRHNHANGEDNRDGHGENFSWNNGVEGPSDDADVIARRAADSRALLTTLFASRGTIMLCAGDEFGRSQQGNNNAYAQDNAISWIDWLGRNQALESFTVALAEQRAGLPALSDPALQHDLRWTALDGALMTPEQWDAADCPGFEMIVPLNDAQQCEIRVDRHARTCTTRLVFLKPSA